VCLVSCNVVMMFTCTLVRSHPDSGRRGWLLAVVEQEWSSVSNNACQVGAALETHKLADEAV
jgi:hypothetical protein